MKRVLFIGESWFTYSVHQKGFDVFHTAEYVEGATSFIKMLEEHKIQVDYVPAHKIEVEVPDKPESFEKYNAVIISDVGANSFLLGRRTFNQSEIVPNKLQAIKDYVAGGGGLLMVGGYMSFTGIDAKARYAESPLKECLPVNMLPYDDRVEIPEGIAALKSTVSHPVTDTLPEKWSRLLGYNRFMPKAQAITLATVGDDPLLVVDRYFNGKSAAFASDLAPHWAPPEFVNWKEYPHLWIKLIQWLTEK